jgi:hypothetical protein
MTLILKKKLEGLKGGRDETYWKVINVREAKPDEITIQTTEYILDRKGD